MKNFVSNIPYAVKFPLLRLYSFLPGRLRYSRVFWKTYGFLRESQWWKKQQLEDYQMQQLGKLLDHAYNNVPYYRRIFDERGLKPSDIKDLNDLGKLPYLTKDSFRMNFDGMVAENLNRKSLLEISTSGTSGKPLQFYASKETREKELAFVFHQWERVGFTPDDFSVQVRGDVVPGKVFHYDPKRRALRLSPGIGGREEVAYYLRMMGRFKAKYLHGYTGSIAALASRIRKYGFKVPFKLRAVLFASEAVYQWERDITQEVFNCRTYSFYGMSEQAVIAGECEKDSSYHCVPQYGITEIDGDTKEIIGTSFLNYANPFIRYRTTDRCSDVLETPCGGCGRAYYPILGRIEGRLGDLLVSAEGKAISSPAITHLFKHFKEIRDNQIIQETPGLVNVKIVPWPDHDEKKLKAEIEALCRALEDIMSGTEVKGQIVDNIQRAPSGKFKWIISKVSDK